MKETIYIRIGNKEYYNVPKKVGTAISVLLDVCDQDDIVSAEVLEEEERE